MKAIGYTRVSSDKQDLQKQEHLLLKYAQQHDLRIQDFIEVEISSRRDTKERRIDELLDRLDEGDVLLVAELSRFGRNMLAGREWGGGYLRKAAGIIHGRPAP
jgi:DNA invertase Pin-like site-specific DNA recombinase